jgi:cytochrome P450
VTDGKTVTVGVAAEITVEALEEDPYPIFARLRAEEPVGFAPAVGLWLVTRRDDVEHVDLHPELFTGETEPSTLNRTLGKNMLGSEGAPHARIRSVVEPPFRPRAVEELTAGFIPGLAHELLDGLDARGGLELVSEFAEPMSVLTLRHVLGLDEVPAETLGRWFGDLCTGLANFEGDPAKQAVADAASEEATAVMTPVLERLLSAPDGSALSHMLHAEAADGSRLDPEEVLANVKLMLTGGLQEPRDLISLAVWALLSHPEQHAEVLADPGLIRHAVEETARCYTPVGTSTRQTTRQTELAGVELGEGELVAAVLSSANRDERHWRDPDHFDIHRREGAHLAFSTGAHYCLGAWLGCATVRTALRVLLERLPGLRLDPEHEVVIRGWEFRAPVAVRLVA